jgi:hypothetical protein
MTFSDEQIRFLVSLESVTNKDSDNWRGFINDVNLKEGVFFFNSTIVEVNSSIINAHATMPHNIKSLKKEVGLI